MQWDAAALAAQDGTGLLPRDGALYFFSHLGWGNSRAFRFLHASGDQASWAPIAEPPDLPAIYGDDVFSKTLLTSPHVPPEHRHGPRRLPRWPFRPVGIDDTPKMPADAQTGDGPLFWADSPAVSEALLRAQDPRATPQPPRVPRRGLFERPFAAFPQDWAAVRVVAVAALEALEYISPAIWSRFLPGADEAARAAQAEAWRREALRLYAEAAAHPAHAAVPRDRTDTLWDRIATLEPILGPDIENLAGETVNLSLGLGSEAAASLPAALVNGCAWRHSLATLAIRAERPPEFKRARGLNLPAKELDALYEKAKAANTLNQVRDIWAPPPNRIFGPPSYVQGDVEDYVHDWLLLLELSTCDSIGLPLGDGVLQFLIRPDDLRARRFDKVVSITTGH